jgi:bifunctional oligoribonuclease and PAP phosphatase NrnA
MEAAAKKLKRLIDDSQRILVTSHISPDADAVSAVLLFISTLELNFPDKKLLAALEEEPADLDFIDGYSKLEFGPITEKLEDFKPGLLVMLDGNNYERASRKDGQRIRDFIKSGDVKTAVIDHHQIAGKDEVDVFINCQSPSTVQDVYCVLLDSLKLKQPTAAAQTAMTGFYADTGGFLYVKAGQPDRVFGFAERLVAAGADVEKVKYQLENYTLADMAVIGELARNISQTADYNYSFLKDDFISDWMAKWNKHSFLQRGTNAFLNNYIRNIGGRSWGFIVYKNVLEGDGIYSASFRSQSGRPDVSFIAGRLGGGGHKPAAGARFEAASVKAAVAKVQAMINDLAAAN